jgi:adenosylcobinamide hydrolase
LPGVTHPDPGKLLEFAASAEGYGSGFLGLLTPVPVQNLCVLRYDFITVFIVAGLGRGGKNEAGGVSIIVCSAMNLPDSALVELVMVASEAKAEALLSAGENMTGTPVDGIIAVCEGGTHYDTRAGRSSEAGRRVREAVLQGIPIALARSAVSVAPSREAFFVYSRINGEHWVEWTPEHCQYYPCHFQDQCCDFCYCPFYPCGRTALGKWAESSSGGRVWNCAGCTLLHEPAIAAYLKQNPDATLEELIQKHNRQSGPGRT